MLDWNSLYKSGTDFGTLPEGVLDNVLSHVSLKASKTFLDIGCGTGHLTRMMHDRGYVGLGVDLSAEAVEIAKSRSTEVDYREFDVDTDEFSTLGGPFGLIICKHVYAFVGDKDRFLEHVRQLLESDGLFMLLTPLAGRVTDEKRNIAVDADELRRQVAQYFSTVEDRELLSGQLLLLAPNALPGLPTPDSG